MVDIPQTGEAMASERRLRVVGTIVTNTGKVRPHNEDAILSMIDDADRGALLLVADGMGGHAAGEVASALATKHFGQIFQTSRDAAPRLLAECFAAANNAIRQHGRDNANAAGLGTTCTALIVRDGHLFLGHVGDSRAYLLRGTALRQLTTDHTLVGDLVRSGTISAAEAAASTDRNVLLRALGVRSKVEPEIWQQGLPLLPDDRLVLCSDGLTDLVNEDRIGQLVSELPPANACEALLDCALSGGGFDNVSVGVFHMIEYTEAPREAKPRPTRPTSVQSDSSTLGRWTAKPCFAWFRLSRGLKHFGRLFRFGGAPWMDFLPGDGFSSAILRKIW